MTIPTIILLVIAWAIIFAAIGFILVLLIEKIRERMRVKNKGKKQESG